MDSQIIVIILTVIAVFIAWKLFKGIVKTLVLAAILIAASIIVFGGFA